MEEHRICPWWFGYLLLIPLRRWVENPRKLLGPYVRPGMTVLEPGSGMGFFTLELARMVGPSGRVVATDLQPKMLLRLQGRLDRAGLRKRVDIRAAEKDSSEIKDLTESVDVALALHMLHEAPDVSVFLKCIRNALKPKGIFLVVEPRCHVSRDGFETSVEQIQTVGFTVIGRPRARIGRAVLLRKSGVSEVGI